LDDPDQAAALPPFWADLAALGWLGLALPEVDGGQGAGWVELAVVAEALGRTAAPGPFLPTVLAAAAVVAGGPPGLRSLVVPTLVGGGASGAIAFPATTHVSAAIASTDGSVRLSGTARPVPVGGEPAWLVLAATSLGGVRYVVVSGDEVALTPIPGLDPGWPLAAVTVDGVVVPAERQLSVGPEAVDRLTVALSAATCAGGASWCVEVAAAYAATRRQFGRPIGQFQAVKHRCADMLVTAQQIEAAAWDAVGVLDRMTTGAGSDEADLAAAVAGAIALDGFVDVAKGCIQVLGGIGFTWEHDAHRYLRRATALRQLVGGGARWRAAAADAALSGVRRRARAELVVDGAADGWRSAVRAEVEPIAALPAAEQRAALVDSGLLMPHWPPPWGRAAGPGEQIVIDEELRRVKVRRPHLAIGAWAAPTIAAHGTVEQQERWVRPTLLGTIAWCQLFSEPDAGSDLAALTTKARPVEGGWMIDGQKVWTSLAAQADWGICLARTDPGVPKHAGITYFVVDMSSEGIEIRPLREMTGNNMFNEVFLTNVFVPDDCVIGAVHGGWPLARTTLGNERVTMGQGASFGGGLEPLLALTRSVQPDGLDPVTRDGLGALIAEAQTVALLGERATHRAVAGAGPGAESSVRKLLSAEHDQRTQEFGLSLLGGEGATVEGPAAQWTFGFLANRCLTIAGGTSEVQRNVIAERLLGLPRHPEPGE
jgi:alkylation response protein AidB-like acyl-CoA dehydrogenase